MTGKAVCNASIHVIMISANSVENLDLFKNYVKIIDAQTRRDLQASMRQTRHRNCGD